MSNPIWSKPGATGADEEVQAFLAGEDVLLDRHLFAFDIAATRAHAGALKSAGILSAREYDALDIGLAELGAAAEQGLFELGPPHEDGHSAIEAFLTERLGDVGRKVHTGRSRNDQVQVATRLYMRDRLEALAALCIGIATELLARADADGDLPMPGYTHIQRAVPSSVGLWMAGLGEAFTDIAELALLTRGWMNTNPLGTAAGYGVNLPLDRDATTVELGFDRMQVNPMYAQNSRGRFELQALGVLAQATLEARRLAWDLSLFNTEEFGFVRMPDRYTTGSSIMPNKRNPDVVELLRGMHGAVQGALAELQAVISLPSGYQRDLQATKGPLIRAFEGGLQGLGLVPGLVAGIEFDAEAMREAIAPHMHATDVAIERARDGLPFREAYQTPPDPVDLARREPDASLEARVSPGACADLRLPELNARLEEIRGLVDDLPGTG
ncbi:MAG: argininosuccinate lyase [Pseudomonadota bacterium]